MTSPSYCLPNIARILFFLFACLLLAFVLTHNHFLFLLLFSETNESVRFHPQQWMYTSASLICFSAAYLTPRWNPLRQFFSIPIVVNGLFALFTLVMPLMLLELILRQVMYLNYPAPAESIFIPDDALGWRMKPNTSGICGHVQVRVNSRGLRGPEFPEQKEPSEKRLLILGDSVTFGHNLEQDADTLPAKMDENFKKDNLSIRIINGGVNGYSTWHEYRFLKEEGLNYLPDAVLLNFVLNDVHETYRINKHGLFEHNPLPALDHSSLLFFSRRLILRFCIGPDLQQAAAEQEQNEMAELIENPSSPDVKHLWTVTVDWIEKIHQLCRDRQIPLIVALFPTSDQLKGDLKSITPQIVLHERLEQISLASIDLLPVFHRYKQEQSADPFDLMLDQTHFTPLGSKIVADALADFCRRELHF